MKARAQGPQEILRPRPPSPSGDRHGHGVHIRLFHELAAGWPATAYRGVHHLDESAVTPPRDHEVCQAVRAPDDDDRRERRCFRNTEVLPGNQDLFCVQTQSTRRVLDGVDRCAVDVGLARFAQPSVAGVYAISREEAAQGGRTAVHRGGLDHFREKQAWPAPIDH